MEHGLQNTCGIESESTGAMKVLCVIPARGGSRNAPLQNFRLLAGKPLLAYTAETALAAARLSKVVLSTDDEDVAEVGRRCGLQQILRSAELSRENTPVERVVEDAVRRLEAAGESCDAVCVLDPASPFRRPEDIDRCIEMLERTGADSVATVVPVPQEYHPQAVYFQTPDGTLCPSAGPAAPAGGSAGLPPAYHCDGSVYVIRRDALMGGKGLFGARTAGYVVDPVRFVKLDRPEDWGRAERIARLETHKGTAGRIAPLAGPRLNVAAGWIETPIPDAEVAPGVGPLREGALGFSAVARAQYQEPERKAANPRWRDVETPFVIREALLPPEREIVGHEFLDPVSSALVMPHSRLGAAPSVRRLEDPFRPHAEVAPDIQVAEAPLAAALSARHLEGSELGPPAKPQRREIPGGSRTCQEAAPIGFTGRLGKAAGSVRPEQPFALTVGELTPPRKGRPWTRTLQPAPPDSSFFLTARPYEPESGDLWARERLVHAVAFRRQGRLLPQTSQPVAVRVAVVNTHLTELAGAQPLLFEHPLAGVPPAVVWNRVRGRATARMAESWEVFGQESAVVVYGAINSRAHGVEWPAANAYQFQRRPGWPAKAGSRARIDPYEMRVFETLGANLPASADLATRLQFARARKLAAPGIRPDTRTAAAARPSGAEFPDTGQPRGTPLFLGVLRIACMPAGVFHFVEIEDHEDYRTWTRAPYCAAELLMPDSGCGVRMRALLASAGYNAVFAGPYTGTGAHLRLHGEFPPVFRVALVNTQVDPVAMDFAAIAEAGSTRWRLPFKRTAGLFT